MEGIILGNRYELIEKIGGGGMAVVYKARCRLLNRYVAVKILRLEFTNDEEFIKRFQVEAQSAASLSHPNIVSIYDVGQQENIHYIVMEFIEGITLKEYIAKKKCLSWRETVNIAEQICSAIEHAHSKNIIHRDIKPHNIMLTSDGIAKVTDFGIARAVSSSTITMVGSTIGSVHYFSPEQARGGYVDEKSDLYSLGITMYEMATGKLPFNGESPVAVALMHLQETPVQPMELNPDIPKGLNDIIMKAITKEQDKRYQTATQMLEDLQRVREEPDGSFVKIESQEDAPTKRISAINDEQLAGKDDNLSKKSSAKNKPKKSKYKERIAMALAIFTGFIIIAVTGVLTYYFMVGEINAKQTAKMPDFTNRNYEKIKDQIKKDFDVVEIRTYREDIAKDFIYQQDPKPGTPYKVNGYTQLKLYISNGPEMVRVPNLTNKTMREAEVEFKNLGFEMEVKEEFSDKIEKGRVTRTDPEAGTMVKAGSIITVYQSKGPEIKKTIVPDLSGMTESEAKNALQEARLKLGNMYPKDKSSRVDRVESQKPEAGEEVDENTAVDIWFSEAEQVKRHEIVETISLKDPQDYGKSIKVRVDVRPSDTNETETVYEEIVTKQSFPLRVRIPIPEDGGTLVTVYFNDKLVNSFWRE